VSPSPEQLAEALAAAARYAYRPPPLVYSSLRPYRPPVPSKPPTLPTTETEIVPKGLSGPPVASEGSAVAVASVSANRREQTDGPVWQALLDVSVWRSRPWWWRLAASLVVKRLNR
jgi:hypothetical protein